MDLALLELRLNSTDNEKKIESLIKLKQDLINLVEINDFEYLNSLLKLSIKSNNVNVILSGLSCLPYYFPLLLPITTNSTSTLTSTITNYSFQLNLFKKSLIDLLPFDKLGDSKEKIRDLAKDSILSASVTILKFINFTTTTTSTTTINSSKDNKEPPWNYLSKLLIESFNSKNIKTREQSLYILQSLRNPLITTNLAPLRPFTTSLLNLLSDSDPTIRSLALSTTITIFSDHSVVSQGAKSDLKKEMLKLDIKEKLQEIILSAVLSNSSSGGGMVREGSNGSGNGEYGIIASTSKVDSEIIASSSSSPPITRSRPLPTTRSTTSSLPSSSTSTSAQQPETIPTISTEISSVYITSLKDLQLEFENMKFGFEGKETELNWILRDKSIGRIRGILKSGSIINNRELVEGFLMGIKSVQEGILKTASSLRTTLATSALSLISELSNALGTTFDPFLEAFLSHTLGMAGQTKKLVATASQSAVTTLLTNSNYHLKTIQLLWLGMNDKIVLARTFISAHLITFVKIHGTTSRTAIESSGGIEILEQCLKKGLNDSNLIVKENTRTTYWLLKELFPKSTDRVYSTLDVTTIKQLDKSDPSKKIGVSATSNSNSTSTNISNSTTGKSARPSMRDMIALAKAGSKLNENQEVLGAVTTGVENLSVSTSAVPDSSSSSRRPLVDRTVSAPLSLQTPTSPKLIPIASIPPPPPTVIPSSSVSSASTTSPRRSQIPFSPSAPHNTLQESPIRPIEAGHFNHSHPSPSPSLSSSNLNQNQNQTQSILNSPTKSISGDIEESYNEDDTTNLMNSPAPFPNAHSINSDEEEDFSPPPPPPPPKEKSNSNNLNSGRNEIILPITEPIVDAALQIQARQAELTAERLLEIAREDNDEIVNSSTTTTPGRKNLSNGTGGISTPVSKSFDKDVFEDSPDVQGRNIGGASGKNGKLELAGKNWWMKKAESLFSVFPSISNSNQQPINSPERLIIINEKISNLKSKSIDSNGLRYLSNLSKEVPLLEEDGEDDDALGVDGIDTPVKSTKKASGGSKVVENSSSGGGNKIFWEEDRRFDKLSEGLFGFLLDEKVRDRRETALVLLKNLVQNQFPFISGDEASFFNLLFKLREDPSRSTVAAVESIADLFCNQVEPLYGLGILRTSLTSYLGVTTPITAGTKYSYALGLRMIGGFFERLPVEILEEELPKCRELIKVAINDTQSGDLRRASVNSLVSCQSVLRDEIKLYSILDAGLGKDQLNLLSYYFAKLN